MYMYIVYMYVFTMYMKLTLFPVHFMGGREIRVYIGYGVYFAALTEEKAAKGCVGSM